MTRPTLTVRSGRRAASRAAFVLALGALAACKRHETNTAPTVRPAEEAAPVRVATAVATGREMPVLLVATGTLMPDQQSEVTPVLAGRVTEVHVERGSTVHQGDIMYVLRDVDFRSQAATATAALDQARARLGVAGGHFDAETAPEVRAARVNRELADDALHRAEMLQTSGAISPAEVERARGQALSAREQYTSTLNSTRSAYYGYRSAQVAVAQTRRNVEDSLIRAPFDGEIAERRANVGEYVSPQRAVVTLVHIDPIRVEIQIPQERVPFVHRDQAVDITIEGFTETFHGTIRYLSAALRADTRSLTAEAVIPNHDARLRPGTFVTTRITLDQRLPVVSVPASAVLSVAGTHRAFVIANGRIQERVVAISSREGGNVLIERGIAANEVVATDQLERLTDGGRVAN